MITSLAWQGLPEVSGDNNGGSAECVADEIYWNFLENSSQKLKAGKVQGRVCGINGGQIETASGTRSDRKSA